MNKKGRSMLRPYTVFSQRSRRSFDYTQDDEAGPNVGAERSLELLAPKLARQLHLSGR